MSGNPRDSADLAGYPHGETMAELKEKVQALYSTTINPTVAGDGGYIELIDVKDNTVYIQMSGGCQGCGAADVTLKAGIERMIDDQGGDPGGEGDPRRHRPRGRPEPMLLALQGLKVLPIGQPR